MNGIPYIERKVNLCCMLVRTNLLSRMPFGITWPLKICKKKYWGSWNPNNIVFININAFNYCFGLFSANPCMPFISRRPRNYWSTNGVSYCCFVNLTTIFILTVLKAWGLADILWRSPGDREERKSEDGAKTVILLNSSWRRLENSERFFIRS